MLSISTMLRHREGQEASKYKRVPVMSLINGTFLVVALFESVKFRNARLRGTCRIMLRSS